MTKRTKKKLMKRMGYRRYSNYRLHALVSKIAEECSEFYTNFYWLQSK